MSFSFSFGQRFIAWICLVVFVTTSVVVYPEPARAHISTNPSYSSSIRSGATPNDNLETSVQAGTTLDSCLSLSSKSGRDLAAWQNRISYLVANTKSEPKDEVIACMPMLMAALERDLYHAFEKDCASHEPIETSFIYIGPKIKNDYLICEPTMKSAFTLIESVQNLMSQYDPYLRNNSHVQEIHKRAIFPAEIAANDLFHNQALQIPYVARNEAFVVQHYNEVPFTKLIWSTFRWYSFLFTAQKTMYLHQTPLAEMFAWASHRNRSGADHTSSTVARMFEVIQGHKIPWRKDGLVDIERQNQFRERFDRPHTEASPEQLHQLLVDVTYTDVQARFSNLISQWVDQLDSYQESENAFIDHHGKTGSLFVPLSTRFKSWMCGDCNQTIQDELGIKHNLGKWMEEHALDTKIARTDSLPVKEDIICTREEKLLEEQKTYNEARAKLKSQCYDMNLTFRSGMTNSRNANKEQIEKDASGYGDDGSWRYEQGLISHDVRYTEWAKTNSRALLGQETLDTYQSLWSNLTQTNVGQLLTADETFGKTLGFSEYGQGLQDCIVEGKIVSPLHSIDPYVAAKRRNLDEQARDLRKSFALHHSLVHRQVEDEEEVLTALSNEHVPALIWYLMDHPSQIAAYTILRGVQNNAHKQSWRQLWRILPVFVASMVGDLLIFSLGSIPARMLYPMIISASFIDAVQTIEGAHFAKIEEKKLRKTLSRYQGDGMWLQQILSQATHDQQTVSSTWQRLAANAIFTGLAATAGIKGKQQVNADPTEGGMMPRVYEKFVLPSLKPITPAPVRIGGRSVIPGASNMGVPINPKGSNYFVDDVIGGAGIGKPITPQGNGGSGSVMTATPKTSTAQMLDTPRGSQLMENIRQPAPSPILNQIRQTQQQANVQVQQTLNPMLHYGTWVAPLVVPMTQNEAPLTIGDLLTNEQLEQIRKTQDASRKSEIETHSPLKQEAEKIIRGRDYSLISDEMILQIQKMTRDTGELGRLARAWLQRYKETHNIERDVINLLNGYQTKNIPFTILHLQEIERMAKDDSHLIERGLARDFLYMATLNQTYARLAKPREMSANAIQLKQNFDLLIAGLKQFFPNLGEKKLLEFANHIHENFYYTPNWTLTNGKFSGYTYLQLDPKFVLSEGRTYELNLIFVLNPNKETRIVVKRFLPDDAKIYSIGMLLKLMQDGQLVQRRALAGGDLALPNETYSYLTANSDLSRPAQPFVAEEYEEIPRTYSTPAPPEHFIPSNNPIPQPITTPLTNPVESPSIQDPQTNQILNSLFLFEKYGINVDRPAPFSMIESGPAYRPVPKKAPRLPDRHKKEPKTPPTKPAQKPTKNTTGQNSTGGNTLLPPTTPINLIVPSSDSNFPIRPSANHWEEKLKIEIEPTTQKTMWQLLNEAMSGEFTIPHIMALRNAKDGCLKENADKEFCTQIISRLYSIDYAELKKFSIDPKEFIEWWETLKYVMVDGKIIPNPFTPEEIAALYQQATLEFQHAIWRDPDAKAAEPHMIQHMASVDSKRALVEALGINFEYYRLLVFLHDAGKYIASARVLRQALEKYEKEGQQILFGKVVWHDQSTVEYLLDLGQRLNIDPAKTEHLIKDIIGHNDGSKLPDIFWNQTYPNYPLPLRLECYLLALFDRMGQGDWTGAAKILPKTRPTVFFDKVHDAYYENPNNTIRQLEVIYQSILNLLQNHPHSDEAKKLLKETFDEAVAMQRETMDGYSRLAWSTDHTTVSITSNGKPYTARTVQEFLRPEFQEALISSGNNSGNNSGGSNTPPSPIRPSAPSGSQLSTDKPNVTIVMPRPNPYTSPVQTIFKGENDEDLTIILNQGLPFNISEPVLPRLETDIYFGDPLPESNDEEREAIRRIHEQNKSRLQKAQEILDKGLVDIAYNREICIIAHTYNNALGERARRFISGRGIDCRVYQRFYYELSPSEAEYDFPDDQLDPLKAIEGIFAETDQEFNLTALAIDVAFGKKKVSDLRLLDEICRLYEGALTPAVHNKVFEYISSQRINCYTKIIVPTSDPLSANVRHAIAKHFSEFLDTQSLERRDEWRLLLKDLKSKDVFDPSDTPKAPNVFYIMDEIFRLIDHKEKEAFFLKALKSRGENIYSPRDLQDSIQGQMLTRHLKTLSNEEAELIRLHLISKGEIKGQDEDGRLRSITFSNEPYNLRMRRQLKSIRIKDMGINVEVPIRTNWDEVKQDVDGYIYIPGEDVFQNKYYFKFLNPKYLNVKDAQDFFNKQLNDDEIAELTSLIFDQAKQIQQFSPRMRSEKYIQDELWRMLYIAYDLKNLIVYHSYLREVGRDDVEIANNWHGLKESLLSLHASDNTIEEIKNTLNGLDFFIDFEKMQTELFQSIRFFLEAPSETDLQDATPFASTLIHMAEGLVLKLNDKQKFEFLSIIKQMREDEPQKLMYFFQTLATNVFSTHIADFVDDFLKTKGENIQTRTEQVDLNHLRYIFDHSMKSVNPETEASLVKHFTRLSKTKKHIKHLKDSIFSIQLTTPYLNLVTINFEEARTLETVTWVPVRDAAGHTIKFLEYVTNDPQTYTFLERSTLDYEADPTEGEDVVLNDYQHSKSPTPGKPEFNLGYMNQFRQNISEGPNATHHTAMKRMMAHFMEAHQNERILFVPAREILFGVPLEQFKIEFDAERRPTVITQRIFEGYTTINDPALENYLTRGLGLKRIFVLRSKNTAALYKGDQGKIQTLVPDLQQYRISLVLNPGGDENIELIFLEEKEFH